MLKAKLVIVGGDAKQGEVRLKVLPTIIGRGKEATLTLPHALVSRQHCKIFEENGRLYVKDLSSLNGTYVNNKRIDGQQPLDPDQLLTLGNVTFRAVYKVAAELGGVQQEKPSTPAMKAPLLQKEPLMSTGIEKESLEIEFQEIGHDDSKVDRVALERETDPADVKSKMSSIHSEKQADAMGLDKGAKPDEPSSDVAPASGVVLDDEDLNQGPEQSISDSAISHLPSSSKGVSFTAGIEMIDNDKLALEPMDAIQIDLGKESAPNVGESSTELDSFVRKLPK